MFDQGTLQDFAPGEGMAAGVAGEFFDDSAWIPVAVPGDVHTALIAAGRIPDPFYDRNELECAWVEHREWWYRLHFEGPATTPEPGERLQLVFAGLDTFVTIWLNGVELGTHQNMFREAVFDVTSAVRVGGQNTLALCFDRPLAHAGAYLDRPAADWMPPRVAMRKAQFGYGWDWGPRLPTVGIWRPVELRRQRHAAITGVHFATVDLDRAANRALLAVTIEAEHFAGDGPLSAVVTLRAPGDDPILAQTVSMHGPGANLRGIAYIELENPILWWTHDLGDPALYRLEVALLQGSVVLDRDAQSVGIRTIALDQSPDPNEPGTRFFRFVLNGVPVFARGANWIPADSFVGAITPERYSALIGAAREANHTMLRVWGGG
ncbi:MAG: glycoside hydrolase family 2 protein, partial [Chloroflexota bacterium]